MWYKFALTEIEPTGQLNFPDMGHGKLDFNDLRFETVSLGKKPVDQYGKVDTYRIKVMAPGAKEQIAFLDYGYDEISNIVLVFYIKVFDIKKTQFIYQDAIMTNSGRGIATKLYEKLLEDIRTNPKLSNAKYVYGNVHSLQSYNAKNKVFGEPESVGKNMDYGKFFRKLIIAKKTLEQYKEFNEKQPGRFEEEIEEAQQEVEALENMLNKLKISSERANKMVAPSSDGEFGTEFGGKSFDSVHTIPEHIEESKEIEKDPNQMELFKDVV
jgi:hypothetical protein